MNQYPLLTKLAVEALIKADGNWSDGAQILEARLKKDPKLKTQVAKEVWNFAVCGMVRHVGSVNHRHALHRLTLGFMAESKPTEQALAAISASIYDFPLAGGKKLGDATRPELLTEADWHQKLVTGNLRELRWKKAVASMLPDDQTRVRDALSETELLKIKAGIKIKADDKKAA